MRYDDSTRDQFDQREQFALDKLSGFGSIEVLSPEQTMDQKQWFVQCWLPGEKNPVGAYGDSTYSAAMRLLRASRCWPEKPKPSGLTRQSESRQLDSRQRE